MTQLAELAKKREALAMSTLTVFIVIGVILVGIVGFAVAMFLKRHKTERLRARFASWRKVQAEFVDDPKKSVTQRTNCSATTRGYSNVSTEDLNLALQRYRSFFGRILSV